MNKWLVEIALTLCLFFIAVPAGADIVNGGFEAGSLAGWVTTGQTSLTNAGFDPRTNNVLSLVGVDSHSAKVGDQTAFGYTGSQYSSLSQVWEKGATFDHLYFAWAAVGLVPTNNYPHSTAQTPWFQIKVEDITTSDILFSQEYFTGNIGSITPGWLPGAQHTSSLGTDDPGIWYYRPWTTFDLNLDTIADGDTLKVTLTTRDCTPTGHASYAYLDGFGTTPPIIGTPEPGSILLLMSGLIGLAMLRKKY